jgi:hypothetical protein
MTSAIRRSDYEKTRDWLRHDFDIFEQELARQFEAFEARIDVMLSNFRDSLIRWMFFFWIANTVTTAAIVFAAFKLFR